MIKRTQAEQDRQDEHTFRKIVEPVMPYLMDPDGEGPERFGKLFGMFLLTTNGRNQTAAYVTLSMVLNRVAGMIRAAPDGLFEDRMVGLCKELEAITNWHLEASIDSIMDNLAPQDRAELEASHAEIIHRMRTHTRRNP